METWQNWIKDKKIVFFVAETIPSISGIGLNAFNFASALQKHGSKSKVICYNYNKKSQNQEFINQVIIFRIAYYNRNIFTKFFSLPCLILNYYKQVKECDLLFIYGKYLVGYEFILFFSILLRKKTIFRSTLLGNDDIESIRKQSKVLWPIRKFLLSKIWCYFSINSSFTAIWHNIFNKPPFLFESFQGVDIKKFCPSKNKIDLKKNLNLPCDRIIFLACGDLIERKGYRDIYTVLSKLDYPFILIIAGHHVKSSNHHISEKEVAEMKNLYNLGKEILEEKIFFLGVTNDIEKYYKAADVFIHAAYHEGTPNVILEAMASGIPIICRKLNGLSGELLINKENCIEFSNVLEFQAILINMPEMQIDLNKMVVSAMNFINDKYTFDIIAKKLIRYI